MAIDKNELKIYHCCNKNYNEINAVKFSLEIKKWQYIFNEKTDSCIYCPYCGKLLPTLDELVDNNINDATFFTENVFKKYQKLQLPIYSIMGFK